MTFTVDFSSVSDEKGKVTPGVYVAKVKEITKEQGASGYPYLKWNLLICSGKAKGLHINHITTLKPAGLFNLRNTLIACGLNVPKSVVKVDPNQLKGRTLGIKVEMRKINDGNEYPNVVKTMPASDVSADESITSETPPVTVDDGLSSTIITEDDL